MFGILKEEENRGLEGVGRRGDGRGMSSHSPCLDVLKFKSGEMNKYLSPLFESCKGRRVEEI